jgi:hypothetical protein
MLLVEAGMTLLVLALSFFTLETPSLFKGPEQILRWLARRRLLSVLTIGIMTIGLRASLLPILPIPYPGVHDEFSYLLMADTFAHGRLTNATHPMWVHFESITVIHQPTYCSVFYPAQGIFLALGQVVVGHPFWGVCLSVGLMSAAITWMLQGWVPSLWAIIGGIFVMIRLGTFSYWANSYFGGAVPAIGGALVLGALPRIKKSPRVRYALLMGLGLAILANSRPYEGLFFSLPIAITLMVWLWRKKDFPRSIRLVIFPLGIVLVATLCFMFFYFWRTTGDPLRPPYFVNLQTYFVDPGFPWRPLRPIPHYHHEVMRRHYLGWSLSLFQSAQAHPIVFGIVKLLMLWFFFLGPLLTLPFFALGMALPYGATFKDLGSKNRFLLLVCGSTLLGLLLPAYANPHYAAPLTAAMYALVIISMQRVRRWRTGNRRAGIAFVRTVIVTAFLLFLLRIAVPVFHLPLLNGVLPETWCSPWNQLTARAQIEAALLRSPERHLVLVHYGPQHDPGAGWVNNSADIDGSKIVWAHDMGVSGNEEIVAYFKDRKIWMLEPDANPMRLFPYPDASKKQDGPLNMTQN